MELLPDSGQVLNCLQRGAHRIALEIYKGAVLPRSEAPGVVDLRERVSLAAARAVLRTAASIAPQVRGAAGGEVRRRRPPCGLKLLPPRSPKRAAVVADLERMETELSA